MNCFDGTWCKVPEVKNFISEIPQTFEHVTNILHLQFLTVGNIHQVHQNQTTMNQFLNIEFHQQSRGTPT